MMFSYVIYILESYSGESKHSFFSYATNWCLVLEVMYFGLSGSVTLHASFKRRKKQTGDYFEITYQ